MSQQIQPGALIALGFASQFVGIVAGYQFVTGSAASAAFVWVPAGAGLLMTTAGLTMWFRRNDHRQRLTLAGILLLVGTLLFGVGALGHAFVVLFLVAIPTMLLGVGMGLWAMAIAIMARLRIRRCRQPAE